MTNFRDLLQEVRSQITDISIEKLHERLDAGETPILLDVREAEEVQHGTIPGAKHLSRAHFESRVEDVLPDKQAEIIVYCQTGVRSAFAARTLAELGYPNVLHLRAGFTGWKDKGLHYDIPYVLNASQRDRYSRHLILPEVREEGQIKFLKAKVLCIGAGGLSSPALLYLAAAGVGTIGVVDSDVVEENNLQRQIVHNTDTVGMLKAESAKEALRKLNPDVNVVVHAYRIEEANAADLISQYDIVVDGCDNFDTRYVVNDAAVALGKPVVHGAIFRFEGMASTFIPNEGPCYRCLYPEAPPPELAPT